MKIWILNILLCLLPVAIYAQKEKNVWAFGEKAGFDFNTGIPLPIQTGMDGFGEGCATICNADGQLLFYTEGSIVWDKMGNVMPNGNNLTSFPPPIGYPGITATSSCSQSAVIVAIPDSPNKYYIFSMTEVEMGTQAGRMYYSVVDMNLNGGMGDIIANQKGILLDSILGEKMTVVTGEHCNIWLLTHSIKSATYKAFEITNAGINPVPVLSNVGVFAGSAYNSGVMKVSHDRKKIVAANITTGLEMCDFDAATGMVSNPIRLSNRSYYGACFSPDNSKLYAAMYADDLEQYDLTSGNATTIINSKNVIGSIGFTDLQLGPDKKIYLSDGVINLPNMTGTACDFVATPLPLLPGTFYRSGLPNDVGVIIKDTAVSKMQALKICFRDNVLLYANDSGWDYKWDNGSLQTYRAVYEAGTYTVSYYTAPCTYHRDTFKVTSFSHLPAMGSFAGCGNGMFAYLWILPHNLDTGAYTYTWADGAGNVLQTSINKYGSDTLHGVATGSYFINMKSADGCDTTFEIEMLPAAYHISFTGDTLICFGDSAHFKNTSQGAVTYVWHFGDDDTSTQFSPAHLYRAPGTYKMQLVSYPCNDTVSAFITVDSTPYLRFVVDTTPLCVGKPIKFYPLYQSSLVGLDWDFGEGIVQTINVPIMHAFSSAGAKTITVTGHFRACADTMYTGNLIVGDYPVVNIGPDTSVCAGQAVHLTNLVNSSASYLHLWSTGAATSELDVMIPGVYWLTVAEEHGCTTTDSAVVGNGCYIAIPNAFSPNGDGINDYFFPRDILSRGVVRFQMNIYSRWGSLLFETNNTTGQGWDGTFNGNSQQEGVYVYLIEATFANGTTEKYKGNLTLIR